MRAQSSPRPGRGEAANNPPASARTFRLLSYKHPTPVRPLECALPRFPTTVHSKRLTRSAKSFRMRTYEKTGGRGPHPLPRSHALFTPKETYSRAFRSSYPRKFAASKKSAGFQSLVTNHQSPSLLSLYFQQLPTIKLNYPMRIVHPERSEGSLRQPRSTTNCLALATRLLSLHFQSLPTIKFRNPFVLITMRIAPGWAGPIFQFRSSNFQSAGECC